MGGMGRKPVKYLGSARGKEGEVPLVQSRFASILPHHRVDRQVTIHQCVMEPPAGAPSMASGNDKIVWHDNQHFSAHWVASQPSMQSSIC